MDSRTSAAIAGASAIATIAAAVALTGGSSGSPASPATPEPAAASLARPTAAPGRGAGREHGREDCSTRSEAEFPGAYTDPRNIVAGPLVLMGGAWTDAETVREFRGNKFPLLVKAGHTVTVRLAARARRIAGLAYGRLPQGETRMGDTYRSVTFVACRPGRPTRRYRPEGPSGSYASGTNVTFWSGFVLTREPACLPLYVYVDDEPSPWRVGLALGRRCDQ